MTDKNNAVLDGERLLTFSRFLKNGPCQFESTIQGESMGKTVPAGSRIRVRFASDDNLRAGQIVTYIAEGRIVAHRLMRVSRSRGDRYVITCGDSTVCCDVPMPVSAVIGILTELQSNGIWKPVPQPQPRSFGLRLAADAFSSVVVVALWLHPRCSKWIAAHIIETRATAMRVAALLRRWARRSPPKQAIDRRSD
jgi:hypothetical protein